MEALGGLYLIVWLFLIVAAILAFLMPFFVLRIRNEMIKLNKNMSQLIELLSGQRGQEFQLDPEKDMKTCPTCGKKNRNEDYNCMYCGEPLI